MTKILRHFPNYVDQRGIEPITNTINSAKELFEIDWVKTFLMIYLWLLMIPITGQ